MLVKNVPPEARVPPKVPRAKGSPQHVYQAEIYRSLRRRIMEAIWGDLFNEGPRTASDYTWTSTEETEPAHFGRRFQVVARPNTPGRRTYADHIIVEAY